MNLKNNQYIRPSLEDWKNILEDNLKQIIGSKLLTIFEPERHSIPGVRIGQARYISRKLSKASDDSFIRFPNHYGRHTTLAGIWMFLGQEHTSEYLVTAFGKRMGKGLKRPAKFYGLHVSHGAERSVQFSPYWFDYLNKHINSIRNAEVLICHNHPKHFIRDILSRMLDWSPLPSVADREIMFRFKHETIVRWAASGNFQNLRFFLVECGRLREFLLPSLDRLAKLAQAVAAYRQPSL